MKNRQRSIAGIVCATGLASAFGTPRLAAQATGFFPNRQGELILNIRDAGDTKNLAVDLGQASTYENANGPLTIGAIAASQLTSFFGSTDNLKFSVVGYKDETLYGKANQTTLWVSQPNLGVAYDRYKDITQDQLRSKIGTVESAYIAAGTFLAASTTAVSLSPSYTASYTKVVGVGNWGVFQANTEASTGTGGTGAAVELYKIVPLDPAGPTYEQGDPAGASQLAGTINLSNDGSVTYQPAQVVPEPGPLALLAEAGVVVSGITLFRRLRRKESRSAGH